MTIAQLQTELNASLKAGKSVRVATIRLLLSAVRNMAIGKYGNAWETSLSEADILDTVKKQIKTHKESILAFTNANRSELASKEQGELDVLEEFAPKEMSEADLIALITPVFNPSEKNFGLQMKAAMTAVAGRADGGRVSTILKQLASSK
jgi:uncharacterized protein YqeY